MKKWLMPVVFLVLFFVVAFLVTQGVHLMYTIIHFYYTLLKLFALIGVLGAAFMAYKFFSK